MPNPKTCFCSNSSNKISGIDYSLLASISILLKIKGLNHSLICNATFSIFNEFCEVDFKKLELVFNEKLKFENKYIVIDDYKKNTYNKDKFKFIFDKIRGRSDAFVILQILDESISYLPYHLILINWELSLTENFDDLNILSFDRNSALI